MIQERKEQLRKSIEALDGLVQAAERADPDVRKQQMFGGSVEREKDFYDNLAIMKEKFLRTMYNITKSKSISVSMFSFQSVSHTKKLSC